MLSASPLAHKFKSLVVAGAAAAAVLVPAGAASADSGSISAKTEVMSTQSAQKDVSAQASRKLYDIRLRVKPNNAKYLGRPWKPSEAVGQLKKCFNCTFPVKNAPKKYPKKGQLIKLRACAAGPFGCKNAPVKFYEQKNGFYFIAQKGHFDGAGSKIYFQFYNEKKTGYLGLHVWAYVTKPTVPDSVNKSVARGTWQDFAHKMGVKLHCKHSSQC